MTLTLNIDPVVQKALEEAYGPNLGRAALEGIAIEGFRSGKLSRYQVQQILGLGDRWTTEQWLKDRQVFQAMTLDDVLADADASRRARQP